MKTKSVLYQITNANFQRIIFKNHSKRDRVIQVSDHCSLEKIQTEWLRRQKSENAFVTLLSAHLANCEL
jgi:hypothetical protein